MCVIKSEWRLHSVFNLRFRNLVPGIVLGIFFFVVNLRFCNLIPVIVLGYFLWWIQHKKLKYACQQSPHSENTASPRSENEKTGRGHVFITILISSKTPQTMNEKENQQALTTLLTQCDLFHIIPLLSCWARFCGTCSWTRA
jgi:hypothetical protein